MVRYKSKGEVNANPAVPRNIMVSDQHSIFVRAAELVMGPQTRFFFLFLKRWIMSDYHGCRLTCTNLSSILTSSVSSLNPKTFEESHFHNMIIQQIKHFF